MNYLFWVAMVSPHLAGAIGLFVILDAILLSIPGIESLVQLMIGTRYGWLVVLGLFMLVELGLYVVIFVPLLFIARAVDPNLLVLAGLRNFWANHDRPNCYWPQWPSGVSFSR